MHKLLAFKQSKCPLYIVKIKIKGLLIQAMLTRCIL